MGLEKSCTVYPALRDALTSRFGEPRSFCGTSVWLLADGPHEKTPQLHVVCAGTYCTVWLADFGGDDHPKPAGSVYTAGDVPRVMRELQQTLGN